MQEFHRLEAYVDSFETKNVKTVSFRWKSRSFICILLSLPNGVARMPPDRRTKASTLLIVGLDSFWLLKVGY